jgi:hypothetical protein
MYYYTATFGIHPFVSLFRKESEAVGKMSHDIGRLIFEYFLLSIKKMNMTVVFLQPSLDISFEAAMREASKLTLLLTFWSE